MEPLQRTICVRMWCGTEDGSVVVTYVRGEVQVVNVDFWFIQCIKYVGWFRVAKKNGPLLLRRHDTSPETFRTISQLSTKNSEIKTYGTHVILWYGNMTRYTRVICILAIAKDTCLYYSSQPICGRESDKLTFIQLE